jgi:hypothetical protein
MDLSIFDKKLPNKCGKWWVFPHFFHWRLLTFFFNFDVSQICSEAKSVASNSAINERNLDIKLFSNVLEKFMKMKKTRSIREEYSKFWYSNIKFEYNKKVSEYFVTNT